MKTLLPLDDVFYLVGLIVMMLVGLTLQDKGHPKRLTTALFWFLFGAVFLFGDLMVAQLGKHLAYRVIGVMVVILSLIAGTGQLAMGTYRQHSAEERQASANRLQNWIFLPAVLIPVVTVLCTLLLKGASVGGWFLLDQKQLTLTSLAVSCVCAIAAGWALTGGTPLTAVRESRRLVDAIGWAAILPQMLAMLGGVFVAAQTGTSVQKVVALFVDPDNRFMLVLIYCVGMALFTMVMGNAFAAFPVMTAGIALPFFVQGQHANPAPLMTIGMLAGYCGTLMTPMAANYNIVPAALLELKNKYGVIKVQIATAIPLLAANIVLMYVLVFR